MIPEPEPWHLDRKVPLGLILVATLQLVGFVVWASRQASTLDNLIEKIAGDEQRIERVEQMAQQGALSQATVTEQIKNLQGSIEQLHQDQREMNDLLRQLVPKSK